MIRVSRHSREIVALRYTPIVLLAGVLALLVPGGARADESARLRLVTAGPEVALGAAFEVGIEAADPQDRLGGAVVAAVWFESVGDAWHVASPWTQPMSGDPATTGWLWRARLQAWEPGELTLPSVRALLRSPDGSREEIKLPPLPIRVVEGLNEADATLRDLRSPHPYGRDTRRMLAGALAAFAALLAAVYLARWVNGRRGAIEAPSPPALPPGVWALREIDRRRDLPACRAGDSKTVATEAADVLRRYIQRRFAIPALEMTTAECVDRLRSLRVPGSLPEDARILFEECDLAKFTKIALSPDRHAAIWDDAAAFVRRSTPASEIPAAPASPTAGGEASPR